MLVNDAVNKSHGNGSSKILPGKLETHISQLQILTAECKSRKIVCLIRKEKPASSSFTMRSYRNEFQDIEKKNDSPLHARILHAFLSDFNFSKDKSRVDVEEGNKHLNQCLDLCGKSDLDNI